jgi:hypothetical protein
VPQTGTGQPPARHQNGLRPTKTRSTSCSCHQGKSLPTAQFSEGSHPCWPNHTCQVLIALPACHVASFMLLTKAFAAQPPPPQNKNTHNKPPSPALLLSAMTARHLYTTHSPRYQVPTTTTHSCCPAVTPALDQRRLMQATSALTCLTNLPHPKVSASISLCFQIH